MFLASFDLHRTREATGLVQYVGHSWPSEKLNSGEGFRSSLGIPPVGGNHKRRATVSNRESKLREGSFAIVRTWGKHFSRWSPGCRIAVMVVVFLFHCLDVHWHSLIKISVQSAPEPFAGYAWEGMRRSNTLEHAGF